MQIELAFYGAAGTVTGSCYGLSAGGARILIDCGLFQGSKTLKELNYSAFPFPADTIDAVVLTHAHIDHSGLLPKLMLAGFNGTIHATRATIGLLGCMLPDSGHIQESEVETLNRRNRQRGHREVRAIYTEEDARECLELLEPVEYERWEAVAKGIRCRWWNAGHLLGSASIEIEIEAGPDKPLRLLFSGDIGPENKLLERPSQAPASFDYVICESTYGDTDRKELSALTRRERLANEVRAAHAAGGALLIPSFAVERTQELVTDLVELMDEGQIPIAEIFVDSPLAKQATEVFKHFAKEMANGRAVTHAFSSPHLHVTENAEASKALARIRNFHIIISASGMCDAGRIRHHLKNWLPRPDATVLLVGFQAQGTLGRVLQDGASAVRIQGEDVIVRARICMMDTYSGHADGPELVDWIHKRLPIARSLFLVHGEHHAIDGLEERLRDNQDTAGVHVIRPAIDDRFRLDADEAELISRDDKRRIEPTAAARLDWHNDLSSLILDIGDAVDQAADERGKQVIIRRLRRALEAEH